MPKKQTSIVLPTGEVLELFYIKVFADSIGRSTQTVKRWHEERLLPETFFHDKKGCRLYSQEMIDVVKRAIGVMQVTRGRRMDLSPFSPIVYKEWEKLKLKYTGKYVPKDIVALQREEKNKNA